MICKRFKEPGAYRVCLINAVREGSSCLAHSVSKEGGVMRAPSCPREVWNERGTNECEALCYLYNSRVRTAIRRKRTVMRHKYTRVIRRQRSCENIHLRGEIGLDDSKNRIFFYVINC